MLIDNDNKSMLQSLREAATSLARISQHFPPAEQLAERLESNYIELKDCCNELRRRQESNTF
jgi:DNA repair ATPase RecN